MSRFEEAKEAYGLYEALAGVAGLLVTDKDKEILRDIEKGLVLLEAVDSDEGDKLRLLRAVQVE